MTAPDNLEERLAAVLTHPSPDTADEDLIGFYVAVRRLLGHPPLDWSTPSVGDVLAELAGRLDRPAPRPQPGPVAFGHTYLASEAGDGSGGIPRQEGPAVTHSRPGVQQLPTSADEATARAMHALRRGSPPWPSLQGAVQRNHAIAAQPLRRALEREGWTPPGDGVGRCGATDALPIGPPVFCALPAGHDGWHRDGATEWGAARTGAADRGWSASAAGGAS